MTPDTEQVEPRPLTEEEARKAFWYGDSGERVVATVLALQQRDTQLLVMREALENWNRSCFPHPTEHPAMFAAKRAAEAALSSTSQLASEVKERFERPLREQLERLNSRLGAANDEVHCAETRVSRQFEAEVTSLRTRVEALTRELELLRAEYDGYREVIKDEHPDLALKTADLKAIFGSQPAQRKAEWERDALSAKCAELTEAGERLAAALQDEHLGLTYRDEILRMRQAALASSPDSALARVEAKALREAEVVVEQLLKDAEADKTDEDWEDQDRSVVGRIQALEAALRALAAEREKRTTTEEVKP